MNDESCVCDIAGGGATRFARVAISAENVQADHEAHALRLEWDGQKKAAVAIYCDRQTMAHHRVSACSFGGGDTLIESVKQSSRAQKRGRRRRNKCSTRSTLPIDLAQPQYRPCNPLINQSHTHLCAAESSADLSPRPAEPVRGHALAPGLSDPVDCSA